MRQPPALHPRSRLTSSLFATTLFASFFVVALPHILPCPAPRVAYADDGTPKRRRRRKEITEEEIKDEATSEGAEILGRECPIPKPSGLVGEILGFKGNGSGSSTGGKGVRPP